jgi:hypothetical protein
MEQRVETIEGPDGFTFAPAEDRVVLVDLDDDSARLLASVTEEAEGTTEQFSDVAWTQSGDRVQVQEFRNSDGIVRTIDPTDGSASEAPGYLGPKAATLSPDGADTIGWVNDTRHLCVYPTGDTTSAACTPGAAEDAGDSPFLNVFAFSPDGTQIASVQAAYDPSEQWSPLAGATEQVVVQPTTGGAGRVLFSASHLPQDWAITSVTFSRDGSWVYATMHDAGGDGWGGPERLVLVPSAGGTPQVVAAPADVDDWQHAVRHVAVSGPAPDLDQAAPGAPDGPTLGATVNANDRTEVDVHASTPAAADLASVTVRVAEGSTPPASVTDGDAVPVPLFGGDGVTYALSLGHTYSFTAFATDWAGNTTAGGTTTVTMDRAAELTLTGPAGPVAPNAATLLTATSTDAEDGHPLAGRTLTLYTADSMDEIPLTSAVTDASGVAHFTVRRSVHTRLWVRQPAGGGYVTGGSELYQLRVRGTVTITVPTTARRGRAFTVTATVTPTGSNQLVTLQRHVGTRWVTVTRARTRGNRATLTAMSRTAASWELRAVVSNSTRWYGGTSRSARVRIV